MRHWGIQARYARSALLAATLGAILAPPAGAATAFQSRNLAPDPYWQATQGALAVTGVGLTAGLANPAGAFGPGRAEAIFSHLVWTGDLAREWAALAVPLGSSVGVVVDAALLHGPELVGYDGDGVETGGFAVNEWNAGGSFGVAVGRQLTVGVGGRVHRLEDPVAPLTGLGLSAGARWEREAHSLGFAFHDAGTARAGGNSYDLPTHWRAGAERSTTRYRIGASVWTENEVTLFGLGAALHPMDWVSLLGGLSLGQESADGSMRWASGIEMRHQGILVGYAVRPAGPLGTTHQFSVTVPLRGESSRLFSNPQSP